MRKLLTIVFVLTLLGPGISPVYAQAAGKGSGGGATGGGETGGTTGALTSTPSVKTDDASGTRGTEVTPTDSTAVDAAGDAASASHGCMATQMWDEQTKSCVAK
jgi:hypothetical protein